MDAEAAHWLALNRLPALEQSELCALARGRVSATEIVAAHSGRTPTGGHRRAFPDWRAVEADLAWLSAPGRHLITLSMSFYP